MYGPSLPGSTWLRKATVLRTTSASLSPSISGDKTARGRKDCDSKGLSMEVLLGGSSPAPLCPYISLCVELESLDETADPYLPHTRCHAPRKGLMGLYTWFPWTAFLISGLILVLPLPDRESGRPALYSWLPLLHHHPLTASRAPTSPTGKWLSDAFPTFAASLQPPPQRKRQHPGAGGYKYLCNPYPSRSSGPCSAKQ